MLDDGNVRNLKSISNVLHLGLALSFFLIKVFHTLSLLSMCRKAGPFLCTGPHRGGKEAYVPRDGASHKLLLCAGHKAPSKPSWHHFWPPSDLCLWAPFSVHCLSPHIIIPCSFASPGTWAQQPPTCSAASQTLSLHSTFMSQAHGGSGKPFCSPVLEGVCILSHSITSGARPVWETKHNPHFSLIQSDLCFHPLPSISDSITAKLPFEMQRDSLSLLLFRQGLALGLVNL